MEKKVEMPSFKKPQGGEKKSSFCPICWAKGAVILKVIKIHKVKKMKI